MKSVNCAIPEYGCMCMDFTCKCCIKDYDGNYTCQKAKYSLEEKFRIVKEVSCGEPIGISHFGLLHEIADALGMKNSGCYLHSLNQRISKLMREFIKAGYPVEEYRIKCCSWTEKETWHVLFEIKELQNG